MLPVYRKFDLPVGAVLTDNGREFCRTEKRPCEPGLDLGGIERFNGTALDAFFRETMRKTFYESAETLQADLDAWLVRHSTERPHLGHRNMGPRPLETVMSFVSRDG